MASYNRIILMGNLTREPELSYTPSNTAVCKFGLATNHKWKDREGNPREEACFVSCVIFGRSGETFNQYMSKGQSVLVEGRLTLNQWTSPDGEKKSRHEVFVERFTFTGGPRGESGGGGTPQRAATGAPAAAGAGGGYDGPPPPTDDDIPF